MERVIGGNKLYTDTDQFSSNLGFIGGKKLYNTQIQINYQKLKNLNVEKKNYKLTRGNLHF